MAVRLVLLATTFLLFVADKGAPYEKWFAPFSWADDLLLAPLPDKIRGFDHIILLCLIIALNRPDGKGPRVAPMRRTLYLCGVSTVVWFAYGVIRGGDPWAGGWQIYLILSGLLFALAVSAAFRTPEHYALFAKMLLAAAAYRATMCTLYYLLYVRMAGGEYEYITSHDDTVLWVVAMLILIVRIIHSPRKRVAPIFFLLFLMAALLFNQRRLAWVSLAMGVVLVVILMPAGRQKRRVVRTAAALAPIALLYVVVGWGRGGRLFKPLQSLATVSTQEDTSTKARNDENLGLIATANANNFLMGSGWAQPYIEVSNKYTIARFFPLWQYIPHNSIVGLLAFTGVLGFYGYWLAFPTALFLNARMARIENSAKVRELGIVGAAQLLVCANQFYGDMGIYFIKPIYIMAFSHALALRLPILAGVWPTPATARGKVPSALPGANVRSA